jgi:N-methylhydantoinase B
MNLDPITLEVVRGRFDVIAEEMQFAMIRSAYSNIVKEAADTSTAIFDLKGQLVAQASGIPILLGVLVPAVQRIIKAFPAEIMRERDVYIMNDPYEGGTHLPDIVAVSPIFFEGYPLALSCVITHHVDIGGKTPGSLPVDATDIFQEGLRIPPVILAKAGEMDPTLVALLGANSRFPTEFLGDIRAQVAACHLGCQRVQTLARNYGATMLLECVEELLDRSERLTRQQLSAIPLGSYGFVDYLDNDGVDLTRRVRIEVRIDVSKNGLCFDFAGTSDQVAGPFNATPSTVLAAAFYVVRAITDPHIPNNTGCFRPISLKLPPGSLVNPHVPAAVNARSMTFCIIIDALFGALAQAIPNRIPAASYEYPVVTFGGWDSDKKSAFVFCELGCGGLGGRPWADGIDVFRSKAGNTLNSPVEAIEMDFPLRVLRYGLRPDSGGPGEFRGGLGYSKVIEVLRGAATVSHRGDRHFTPPYGLQGGSSGACSESFIERANGDRETIPAKLVFVLRQGDRIHLHSAGGGGFGAPFARKPESVRDDVLEGKVSIANASRDYGVVVAQDTHAIDVIATATRRGAPTVLARAAE